MPFYAIKEISLKSLMYAQSTIVKEYLNNIFKLEKEISVRSSGVHFFKSVRILNYAPSTQQTCGKTRKSFAEFIRLPFGYHNVILLSGQIYCLFNESILTPAP